MNGPGSPQRDRILFGLIVLATLFSLGHLLDYIIRGNHVGWPLTTEVRILAKLLEKEQAL